MKTIALLLTTALIVANTGCSPNVSSSSAIHDTILVSDTIMYHPVRINTEDGSILPWYSSDQGTSYDTVLLLIWNFWDKMETDSNGLKYYMNHQVWKPEHDARGLGGDQINMALSSWSLLYAYTGDRDIVDNMKYLADTYLERSLSDSTDSWPFLPYPYNTDIHSGKYDGDMRNGIGILQPDKAGSFGYELVNLYKITGEKKYFDAAVRIANTLKANIIDGDNDKSPLPFRVDARTGKAGSFFDNNFSGKKVEAALYTSNWSGTMMLFEELISLDVPDKEDYSVSLNKFLGWMKAYPLKTNKWGPFFEDIPGWSDTQTNAITFAMYILQHRDLFPDWKNEVKGIIEWTYRELANRDYEKYKVVVMNEQTVYRVPGNSHSSRQASIELMYGELSGDTTYKANAVKTLNWATYTVAGDGRNRYIRDDIWLTDGYGDYVRHYLRAMAELPELAPANKNRFLGTTSVVTVINYGPEAISYSTFDPSADILRLTAKPESVKCDGINMNESDVISTDGYTWKPLHTGGELQIRHNGKKIEILLSE
jgi:hypothetical protein